MNANWDLTIYYGRHEFHAGMFTAGGGAGCYKRYELRCTLRLTRCNVNKHCLREKNELLPRFAYSHGTESART